MNDDEDYTFTIDATATSTTDVSNITIGNDWSTGDYTTSYIDGSGMPSPTITIDATDYTYSSILDNMIDPDQVENMCKEYPALTKVWTNFKSVYDMTLQDYKGKKEVGDLND